MKADNLKQKAKKCIEAAQRKIEEFGSVLVSTPELGFKEVKSSTYIREQLQELGLKISKKVLLLPE